MADEAGEIGLVADEEHGLEFAMLLQPGEGFLGFHPAFQPRGDEDFATESLAERGRGLAGAEEGAGQDEFGQALVVAAKARDFPGLGLAFPGQGPLVVLRGRGVGVGVPEQVEEHGI